MFEYALYFSYFFGNNLPSVQGFFVCLFLKELSAYKQIIIKLCIVRVSIWWLLHHNCSFDQHLCISFFLLSHYLFKWILCIHVKVLCKRQFVPSVNWQDITILIQWWWYAFYSYIHSSGIVGDGISSLSSNPGQGCSHCTITFGNLSIIPSSFQLWINSRVYWFL